MSMPITLTFHVFGLTITLRIQRKSNNCCFSRKGSCRPYGVDIDLIRLHEEECLDIRGSFCGKVQRIPDRVIIVLFNYKCMKAIRQFYFRVSSGLSAENDPKQLIIDIDPDLVWILFAPRGDLDRCQVGNVFRFGRCGCIKRNEVLCDKAKNPKQTERSKTADNSAYCEIPSLECNRENDAADHPCQQ